MSLLPTLFFDPIAEDGYQVQGKGKHAGKNLGRLELLSMDRRDESNVDEFYKLGSLRDLREMSLEPSFVVTGNQPVVIEIPTSKSIRNGRRNSR